MQQPAERVLRAPTLVAVDVSDCWCQPVTTMFARDLRQRHGQHGMVFEFGSNMGGNRGNKPRTCTLVTAALLFQHKGTMAVGGHGPLDGAAPTNLKDRRKASHHAYHSPSALGSSKHCLARMLAGCSARHIHMRVAARGNHASIHTYMWLHDASIWSSCRLPSEVLLLLMCLAAASSPAPTKKGWPLAKACTTMHP